MPRTDPQKSRVYERTGYERTGDAETWGEFSGFLRLSGVADGDVARLVGQTADHLNQLTRLEKTHPVLAQSAKVARSRLLRPPFSETLLIVE